MLRQSRSQWAEERILLPILLQLARGRPGRFVELGALDGFSFSNTLALERCYNWTGLLVEGNPANFNALIANRRAASSIHSAVCPAGQKTVNFTQAAGATAGQPDTMSSAHRRRWKQHDLPTLAVPCQPLVELMAGAGMQSAHFLSLDVRLQKHSPRAAIVLLPPGACHAHTRAR